MQGYLISQKKEECFGCGACYQACPVQAISMKYDEEKFWYPVIDEDKCIHCDKCKKVCPAADGNRELHDIECAWGGYNPSVEVRENSTSGGAFTAIVEEWLKAEGLVFGAELKKPTEIVHTYAATMDEAKKFRKSKYLQSDTLDTFKEVKQFLKEGKRVLYSGTPCQIAGLKCFLGKEAQHENLLLVEVVCEGVPTPIYTEKHIEYLEKRFKKEVTYIDWRDKNRNKWDFQFMRIGFADGTEYKISRWFNPFWSIWLKHLMSRPSCYTCPFATSKRGADITIADLWGVHLYCPELYGKNKGASLVVCNTKKGVSFWEQVAPNMHGHYLKVEDALRYQSPMRKHIDANENRAAFMQELPQSDYKTICKKWGTKPTIKLLYQKYIWGNRQKVAFWNLMQKFKREKV